MVLSIGDNIEIEMDELVFSYARSGGPGGQNVNKVNSKAVLHWSVEKSASVSDDIKSRFMDKYANRINTEGELVLSSQRFRDQRSNAEDCLERLKSMLESVEHEPVERKSTKIPKVVKQKRIENKRILSKKKQQRRPPEID